MPLTTPNGSFGTEDVPPKGELVTPQTTPRRSKRKLESPAVDSSTKPTKLSKTEVNGQIKAVAPSRSTPSKSSARQRVKAESSPNDARSPSETPKKHTSVRERAKAIVDKLETEVEKVESKFKSIVDGDKHGKTVRERRKRSSKRTDADLEDSDIENYADDGVLEHVNGDQESRPKRKRKTKEEKEAEMQPLASRTPGLSKFVGAHVSMAGGLENSVKNSIRIGGNAFALFLRSQKKWDNPPLKDENRDAFRALAKENGYDQSKYTLPHGSYLVNLAVEDAERAKQSYDVFVDDLHRCEALGIKLYNFHPGHYSQSTLSEGIRRIAQQLNKALSETKTAIPVLENAAGSGTVIGSKFSDLRDIINGISPEHKHRIGVCIDTCHAFAAGYDLRTPDAFKIVLDEFDKTVGIEYLKALHLNDSKAPLDSKKDLHQNIGLGFLGLRTFHNVMNDARLENMPLVLETPCDVPDPSDPTGKKMKSDPMIWTREIKLLESLIGMDPDSEEFKQLEAELSEKGKEEREKMLETLAKTEAKKADKAKKAPEKGQKSIMSMFGG
ncbi:putative dna lyase [Phaeomoniella chlamydospora]|uniref:Apurinic-apyrimidinic endonuclease 1 n=1 Tax=Phaeomoniella chlamydospora TaxID=158046 RepID=A0A0G2GPK1_PHACM|nr:putative dna lyase [Phaeomoniella chlamydospora]